MANRATKRLAKAAEARIMQIARLVPVSKALARRALIQTVQIEPATVCKPKPAEQN